MYGVVAVFKAFMIVVVVYGGARGSIAKKRHQRRCTSSATSAPICGTVYKTSRRLCLVFCA